MSFHLVVINAFGPYARGDLITDATIAAEILAGENAHHVVRIAVQGG
jgi:hypothetical protein